MQKSGKLELTWVGKYGKHEPLEPRILLEKPDLSYGDPESGNMLIHGDNLLALRALEQNFAGEIKCIYIDPPFNTGSRIDADGNEIGYDDGVEHSIWLDMMAERMEILHRLLSNDGAMFIHLDDNEVDYCRVVADEIFGRKNFMNRITIDSRSPSAFSTVNPGVFKAAEYLLFYAKNRSQLVENPIRVQRTPDYAYDKFIENIEADFPDWTYITVAEAYERTKPKQFRNPQKAVEDYHKFIIHNAHRIFRFTAISDSGAGQAIVRLKYESLERPNEILCHERSERDNVLILNGQQLSFYSKNIALIDGKPCATTILTDIWADIAWEGIANEGGVKFKKGKKPERLLRRCLELVTKPGDLVLDSFLGSGTTAAVAHKTGRRWIGIELGEHAYTHCKARLDKVIDGDQSGISKAVAWHGGGGYKFYELAPSLLEKHPLLPIYRINTEYTFEMLCEAICKLEGFTYKPEGEMHGYSSEMRFIHISRDFISGDYINKVMKMIGENQSVLIYSVRIQSGLRLPENVEVKKIPNDLQKKCRFESEVR